MPRVRLDPVTRAAVTETASPAAGPVAATPATGSGQLVTMDRYIVKGKYEVLIEPQKLAEPTGPFTLQGGGRISGNARYEFGLWPSVSIMADDAKFKGPVTAVSWDILRLKW